MASLISISWMRRALDRVKSISTLLGCIKRVKGYLANRMWFSVVCTATVITHIVVDKSTDHAKPHSICFLSQYQRNEINLCLDNGTPTWILKVHALQYANELLVRVRLSFQKLLQTRLR